MEGGEERLKSLFTQLQAEFGVLDRLVYKNKNQHRRSSYFQYLLKVRRDLKLLQSARLDELLESCCNAVTGRKAKNKIHLLESLKKWKHENGKYNILERVIGVARLLSQMVDPMVKAAIEISMLLARSFFMSFSLTIYALLARLKALIQQLLLDVVSLFNQVISISQKKQSFKITQDGLEVFREYYPPTIDEIVVLECLWETDKFVLVEKLQKIDIKNTDVDSVEQRPPREPTVKYRSLEAFLGVSKLRLKKALGSDTLPAEEILEGETDLTNQVSDSSHAIDDLEVVEPPYKKPCLGDSLDGSSTVTQSSVTLNSKSGTRNQVAFISVKKPALASSPSVGMVQAVDSGSKDTKNNSDVMDASFFRLLACGTTKGSLI